MTDAAVPDPSPRAGAAADPGPADALAPTAFDGPLCGERLPVPPGFERVVTEKRWRIGHDRAAVWAWLCDPATFTDSQLPPWRVEFLDPSTGAPAGFTPGVLTTHHGPLLHLPAVIGRIEHQRYRDLPYLYGAKVLSMRLARPVRLEFWVDELPDGATAVRLRVAADVRRWFRGAWRFGSSVFWGRFGGWCERSVAG